MNLERMSLDQLRKLLTRIERQIVEDQLYIENVTDGITQEPGWKTGAIEARLRQKKKNKEKLKNVSNMLPEGLLEDSENHINEHTKV